jgi:hypothetical protein
MLCLLRWGPCLGAERESNILDLMVKARDERGVGHGQVLR